MSKIKIFSLGGLDENGKNTYIVEVDNKELRDIEPFSKPRTFKEIVVEETKVVEEVKQEENKESEKSSNKNRIYHSYAGDFLSHQLVCGRTDGDVQRSSGIVYFSSIYYCLGYQRLHIRNCIILCKCFGT